MARHYYTVTWDQLHRDARALAWRLMDAGPFEGVVAITRGGLIPAAIIARELEVRLVETVSIVTYAAGSSGTLIEEEKRGAPVVIKPPVAAGDGTGFLIVDDLVDTGATARVVRALLPRAHFAAVYAKPAGRETVDSYVTEVSQDTWILFPWDTRAAVCQRAAGEAGSVGGAFRRNNARSHRHGQACPGHPRLPRARWPKDVRGGRVMYWSS